MNFRFFETDDIRSVLADMPSVDETFEKLLLAADVEYAQCDIHKDEMMIKTVACITCQVLVCPLCLCSNHQDHEVISLVKLRECKSLRSKLDDDLNTLQVLQERLKNQLQNRKELIVTIEESSKELTTELNKAFDKLQAIISDKKEEINKHILAFTDKHLQTIREEITLLEQRYTNSTRMIQKVVSFSTNKMGSLLKESQTLPEQLKMTLKESQLLKQLDSSDSLIPGKKFAKVIPSLEALCNICQTMHPEATKVIWSKVPPEKKRHLDHSDSRLSDGSDSEGVRRKRGRPYMTMPKRKADRSPVSAAALPVNGVADSPVLLNSSLN